MILLFRTLFLRCNTDPGTLVSVPDPPRPFFFFRGGLIGVVALLSENMLACESPLYVETDLESSSRLRRIDRFLGEFLAFCFFMVSKSA